jgi:hypothetical protein
MEDVPPKVNEALREKVVAAAKLLGYQADDAFVLKACQLQARFPNRLCVVGCIYPMCIYGTALCYTHARIHTHARTTQHQTGAPGRAALRDAPRPRGLRQDGHLEDAGHGAQPRAQGTCVCCIYWFCPVYASIGRRKIHDSHTPYLLAPPSPTTT